MPGEGTGANLFTGPKEGRHTRRIRPLSAQTLAAGAAKTGRKGQDRNSSDETLSLIVTSLTDDKAEDIVQIDLHGKSSVADHMVICSGRSTRQVTALAEKLADRLKPVLGRAPRAEGKAQGDWVLVDAGDVIVHIFRPEVREFYQLEKMWLDPSEQATTH